VKRKRGIRIMWIKSKRKYLEEASKKYEMRGSASLSSL
jgi:hypothetical protein